MNKSRIYDKVYIGSGPINIIDACLNQHDDQLIIDSKGQIGGAWVAIEVAEFGHLEIGCHIWTYHKASYDFLRKFLELDLVKLSPQPYFSKGNTKLIYDHKNAIISSKYVFNNLIRGKFKKTFNYIKNDPEARFPVIPKPYLYPKGGAREFQEKLISKICATPTEIKLNTEIISLRKNGEIWESEDQNGNVHFCKKVVITATSSIKSIAFENKTIQLNYNYITYTHFHFIVRGKPKKPFSYIRLLGHDLIHRLSDITNQLANHKSDCSVFLVGVFNDKLDDLGTDEIAIKKIQDYLIENQFIDNNQEILYTQKNSFKTAYIDRNQRNEIASIDPSLSLYGTTDLIFGVESRLSEWQRKLTT